MPERAITPYHNTRGLITGHFHSRRGYATYRPRGTPDYLLIYTISGLGRFGADDGREHVARPHDLLLLAPGTYQDYSVERSLVRWELLWAHFQPRAEWLDLLDWPTVDPGLRRLRLKCHPMRAAILSRLREIHRHALGTHALRDRLAMNALEALLLACAQANPDRDRARDRSADARVRLVMEHVAQHLHEPLALDELADVAGLSASRLGHRFREVVGVSPMHYVEQLRIERAKQLLTTTSLSVKEVARQVGYQTQFYFSLRFKRRTGRSPKAFRASPGGRVAASRGTRRQSESSSVRPVSRADIAGARE